MNFYDAREIQDGDGKGTGKWRYTCYNDNQKRTWAVGYCAQDCPGHDTPDEAREHYKQYLLDIALRLDANADSVPGAVEPPKFKCEAEGCEALTSKAAKVGYGIPRMFNLCPEHMNRETVETLFEVGSSFGSF
jgi:hypothetical protein